MTTLLLQTPTTVYHFLPVEEAARVTGESETKLRADARAGKILAGMFDEELRIAVTEDGQLVRIAPDPEPDRGDEEDINTRLSKIKREDFAHLEGVEITVSEAARKYGVPSNTLYKWVLRKYITILGETRGNEGRPSKVLNEAEVAYCAAIYHVRKPYGSRAPLLDSEGRPYLLKNPQLARLRRQAKQAL